MHEVLKEVLFILTEQLKIEKQEKNRQFLYEICLKILVELKGVKL